MQDGLKLKGSVIVEVNGKKVIERNNLIVDVGKAEVAKLIGSGLGGISFSHIAVGSGTTAAASTDTALEVEVMRVAATITNDTTTITGDTATFVAQFDFTSAVTITEYGLFNDATAGTMLSRIVEAAINLSAGDSMKVTWKIQVL